MPELDLDYGDETAAEKILTAGQEARANRASTRKTSIGKAKPKPPTATEERETTGRMNQAWVDLAAMFEARNDADLADVLTRRGAAMTQGLMSLTRSITILRKPLILFLAFLEPVIGFWELGSLLITRYVNRRAERIAAKQQAAGGVEVVPEGNPYL